LNQPLKPQRYVSRLTRDTLALVLAGGRGTRLGDLTQWRAKPAVPFAGCYRIIDFPLSNCMNSGIRRIGVLTQYKAHSLIRHIQQGWGFLRGELGEFIELMPAQQRRGCSWYAGTADAVYQNIDIIRAHRPRYILVLGGDHVYKMDYGTMLAYHVENQAEVTLGCVEVPIEEASDFGIMQVEVSGKVTGFQEKPAEPVPSPHNPKVALVSMGIYLFNAEFLYQKLAEDAIIPGSKRDFGHNIVPDAIARHNIWAFPFRDAITNEQIYWRDVGTVDAYWSSNIELIDIIPELDLYDRQWPIWTYQEQFPPAKFVLNEQGRRGIALDSMVSSGCIVSGAQILHSILSYNVTVHTGALVQDSVVLPGVDIGQGCQLHKVVVESGCKLPAGLIVGKDPVLDGQRFYRTEQGVTLITPEMLGQEERHVL